MDDETDIDRRNQRRKERRENRGPSIAYNIERDGTFSVDEPAAAEALGQLLQAMQGLNGGSTRREPTEDEVAEMERIRAEFLDIDDLPNDMSVPTSVPTASGTNDDYAFDPLESISAPDDRDGSIEHARAAVRAHADGVEADTDTSRPAPTTGIDARIAFDPAADPVDGVNADRAAIQSILEKEMEETAEALLTGGRGAATPLGVDLPVEVPTEDERVMGGPNLGTSDGPATLEEVSAALPFSPRLNDELMDALTQVVTSSASSREMMAAASARWEDRRGGAKGSGGRERRDPKNTKAGRSAKGKD